MYGLMSMMDNFNVMIQLESGRFTSKFSIPLPTQKSIPSGIAVSSVSWLMLCRAVFYDTDKKPKKLTVVVRPP